MIEKVEQQIARLERENQHLKTCLREHVPKAIYDMDTKNLEEIAKYFWEKAYQNGYEIPPRHIGDSRIIAEILNKEEENEKT